MEPIADEKAHPGHGLGGSGEGSSGDGVLLRRRVASAAGLLQRWNLQRIDGEGGGGGILADAKDHGEASLSGGVSSEEKGKIGSMRDAKKDDAHQRKVSSVVGSPAPTWALAFQPSQGTSFPGSVYGLVSVSPFSSSAAKEQDGWAYQELCFLSRKSNGGGDFVGAQIWPK
uniref:DUF834 domain-containing protein n=1 Tax=Oryza meridionalis TaxID=40149 RepID=A0A0E0EW01_9ORYZ